MSPQIPISSKGSNAMKRDRPLVVALMMLVALVACAQERPDYLVDRVPTQFVENGKAISLEVIIAAPTGTGPFPAVMFNHGSTGSGTDPSLFGRTWASDSVAQFFNQRGWLVAFPQRRGRGKSDGLYDEGFEPDRSKYACSPPLSLAGLERALQDLDAVVVYLKGRADVDSTRMLIGGHSRGGILSIVYAGTRPVHFDGCRRESGIVQRRSHHHRVAVGCRCQVGTVLVGRFVARNKQHLIELELLADGLREQQVPEMRRIERAAEYPYPLHCQLIASWSVSRKR